MVLQKYKIDVSNSGNSIYYRDVPFRKSGIKPGTEDWPTKHFNTNRVSSIVRVKILHFASKNYIMTITDC